MYNFFVLTEKYLTFSSVYLMLLHVLFMTYLEITNIGFVSIPNRVYLLTTYGYFQSEPELILIQMCI